MAQSYNNVYFLGVARVPDQAIIVASYSHNIETDLSGVKQVLEQPNMNMNVGKHYSFSVGQLAWHLIKDDMGLIYVMIAAEMYPSRTAHACLEDLQRTFVAKAGDKATTAKDRGLNSTCMTLLQKICIKYDDLQQVDKLHAVTKKVDMVKLVMQENVDIALQNCVKLESIEKQAEELQQQAGVFKRNANELKKKMWWKNIKMWIAIGVIVAIILAIIIGVIASYAQQKKK